MRTNRIDLIEQYILKNKSASLDFLCEHFQVSKNTIRRDIDTLVKKGSIKKVYGGVTATEQPISHLLSFDERHTKNPDAKDAICKTCASFIEDYDTIYIDTGTTCVNLIDYIRDRECTILTNSLQISLKAIPYPNLDVISLPGRLKRETLSFIGTEVTQYLKIYNINKAFMACSGVSIRSGLTNASMEEYLVKKSVLENTAHSYLLADHSKFGKSSLMTYYHLEDIEHIITDMPLEKTYEDFCRQQNIQVTIAR